MMEIILFHSNNLETHFCFLSFGVVIHGNSFVIIVRNTMVSTTVDVYGRKIGPLEVHDTKKRYGRISSHFETRRTVDVMLPIQHFIIDVDYY